jgi:RHS repeat-associated protein
VTHTYVYDAEDIVEERLSTGDTIRYVHGPGIDQVLARTTNGTTPVYYLTDHLGSVVQEVDATQAVTLDREYDPWGVPVHGGATSGYAFTGREWDSETMLYSHRARYYNPSSARFISEDPIGLAGGLNGYAYISNGPTRYNDPFGLCQQDPDLTSEQQLLKTKFDLANDLVLLLAGVLFDPVKIKLSTADDVARVAKHLDSLTPQQMQALREAMEGAGERIMEGKIKDLARLPETEWAKIRHVLRDGKTPVAVVHYWRSLATGIGEFFKFK